MGRRRPVRIAVATLVVVGTLAVLALPNSLGKPKPGTPPTDPGGPFDPGEGSCDVDGVDVSYTVGFEGAPTPSTYRVSHVTVSDISATCAESGNQAQLSVELTDGTTPRASATTPVPVGADTVQLVLDRRPRAEDVVEVHVELAGGRVPIPVDCESNTYDNIVIGTNGDDVLVATQRRNLMYGLDGDDELRGSQQDDCLVGQAGGDHLFGEQGKDVLVGGPGADVLDGGNGKDVCVGTQHVDQFIGCETRRYVTE